MEPEESEQARWFAAEVQLHESSLRAYLHAHFPSLRDVDDVVQESYLRLYRAKQTAKIDSARSYLFAIARNAACALFRRPRIFSDQPVTDFADSSISQEGADAVEELCTRQEIALLLEAIDALPRSCREIFILRKLQGVPQKEIAGRLGLSEQTVQVQVARGARKCAQFLRSHGVIGRLAGENGKKYDARG